MFKRKLTIPDFLLIAVNLVPVYGVWFEGWDAKRIFIVYCLETVIIGLFNILKLATVTLFVRPRDQWENHGSRTMQSGWFFILFFIVHYGFFVFVQTQIFFGVTGIGDDLPLFKKYTGLPDLLGGEGRWMLGIFIGFYALQTYRGFFSTGEYKTISMMRLMFQPYLRIFVQQVIVILGSMALAFGAGSAFIVIFAAIKILAELYLNFDSVLLKAEEDFRNRREMGS